jgi:hypothetical protein
VRRALQLIASLSALAFIPAAAHAAQATKLHVSFTPNRLGQGTTVNISVKINAPAGGVPSPLTGLDLSYPSDLGFDVSGLGLATCSQTRLHNTGPKGCPPDSIMGRGNALAEVPFGPEIVEEAANVTIVRAPQEGGLALLFYADSKTPVSGPIVFSGLLQPGPGNEESIHVNVPLVPSLPGAPDIALVELNATLGPRGLTYYETSHGQRVAYKPQGVLLPNKCPAGGFHFNAAFAFADGTQTNAHADVPCPAHNTAGDQ